MLAQIEGVLRQFDKLIVKCSQLSAAQNDVDLISSMVTLSRVDYNTYLLEFPSYFLF